MKTAKVKKPYPEYPLFAHASNQWAKKIKGRMWYFGTLDDPDAALAKYDDQIHEIQAGRDPRRTKKQISAAELSVYDMCNLYLARQQIDVGQFVHDWLFPQPAKKTPAKAAAKKPAKKKAKAASAE